MPSPRRMLLAALCALFAATLGSLIPPPDAASSAPSDDDQALTALVADGVATNEPALLAASWCLPDTSAAQLSRLFDTNPGGIIGADYPRTLDLGGGAVLWTFQDARFRLGDGSIRTVHNIGVVQTGNCFEMLTGGTAGSPRSWLFADQTVPLFQWYWPLDAELGADGRIYVFMAEMREDGPTYLYRTVPLATRVAAVDPATWTVRWSGSATNAGPDLYGWSIQSDQRWTYLFAHCHRQFGFDNLIFDVLGHDRSCTPRITVARVPKGRLFDPPTYWTGSGWSPDPRRAAPIISRTWERFSNPTQFLFVNNQWMAITKLNDWWGRDIYVERAVRATGPYERISVITPATKCGADCNTYFASWAEGQAGDSPTAPLVVSLSHNRWDGEPSSFYRPTFFTVPRPDDDPAVAARCRLGHCG